MPEFPGNQIVILGAGITGLTAGYELSRMPGSRVVVVEKEHYLGGLAATLRIDRLSVDIGSHRIQSTVSRSIRSYLTDTLGIELLKQPRRGLLYMQGLRFKYPPSLFNMLRVLPLKKSFSYSLSLLERFRYPKDASNYRTAMLSNVGKRVYESFYRDFVYKLWGITAENIAIEGMKRRKTILDANAFFKSITGRHDYFYYPRDGMGSIAARFAECIRKNGGILHTGSRLASIVVDDSGRISSISFTDRAGEHFSLHNPLVISTIPIDELHERVHRNRKTPVLQWREIRIVYLHISENLPLRNETFYFPHREIPCGRISFIQKYSPHLNTQASGTIITFEFPASAGDTIWEMEEEALCRICIDGLKTAGIITSLPTVRHMHSIGIKKAYPIYSTDWKTNYHTCFNRLAQISNLFVMGRRGLFLHCNVDHAIRQGIEAAKIIHGGSNQANTEWNRKIPSFSSFCARD